MASRRGVRLPGAVLESAGQRRIVANSLCYLPEACCRGTRIHWRLPGAVLVPAGQRRIVANSLCYLAEVSCRGTRKQEADHLGKTRGLHCPGLLSQDKKADQQADIPELHCHVSEARQINMNISEIALPQKQCNFYYSNN